MDTESLDWMTTDGVEQRARVLAALADPARLRMVDALLLGDASPSELGLRLQLPSNLLAHHLGVLEREGLVVRHRSQGDRRRTYLRLVPHALDGLLPGLADRPSAPATVARVVFVCTANSARSQLAAALWSQNSDVPVTSAGTHPARAIAPGARAVARRHRLPLPRKAPRSLADIAREDDYLVTVCDNAYENLRTGDPEPRRHNLHWSVPDPVAEGTDTAFNTAYNDIEDRVTTLARHLTAS